MCCPDATGQNFKDICAQKVFGASILYGWYSLYVLMDVICKKSRMLLILGSFGSVEVGQDCGNTRETRPKCH